MSAPPIPTPSSVLSRSPKIPSLRFDLNRSQSNRHFRFFFLPSVRSSRPVNRLIFSASSSNLGSDEAPAGELVAADVPELKEGEGGDRESSQLFEKIRDAEIQRVEELKRIERRADVQLERNLIMASNWSRVLLTMRGKLRGTQWDPENSHMITYTEFLKLLNSNNVHYMEYSHYGQSVSVILPHYKDKTEKEMIFRRHMLDKMPIDGWNDVWSKLHGQIMNIDVINTNLVPIEIYSTVATSIIWFMRLALAILVYVWVDRVTKPVYAKLVPSNLGKPKKNTKMNRQMRWRMGRDGMDQENSLGSLTKSRAKFISASETTGVTFDDFAGQDYIKRELQEIVKILRNEEEFQDKGIDCPKGVLLYGPPGTGKTLLAKAIAGEAGLPFFAANGTDFVEMFIGVAAARVKDLFSTARSFAPSIIFIDEIDAIGSKRGGPDIGGGGAEREQGLLQILTEMDGFKESTSQVLVIGATNRLDILDPALVRKGRFDKIIRVGRPTKVGRLAILRVHAKNKYFRSEEEKETLLQEIAELAVDFTGAELQNILNEAGILTARKDLDYICREELMEALKRQRGTFETGQEDTSEIPEDLKIRLAYRESAVAVLSCFYPDRYCTFTETNIRSIGRKLNMRYTKKSGRAFFKKSDYVNAIVKAFAPKVIEEEIFGRGNMSWISANGTADASRSAQRLILQTGMTAFGKAFYRRHKDLVPNLAAKLEALRAEYLRFAFEKCTAILREYRSAVETIADVLLEKGTIYAEEIWEIYKKSPRIPQPTVNPVDEYGALIYSGRWGIYGISLPGRVTFRPGNTGFSTFGAPRPMETQIISDETWKMVDGIWDKRVKEITDDSSQLVEQEENKPQLLLADYLI